MDWSKTDANDLPYYITDAISGIKQPAHFEPLTTKDEAQLRDSVWSVAIFRDVWPELVQYDRTLKLVCSDSQAETIQGLVRLGRVQEGGGFLQNSLLEASPLNQWQSNGRRYRGVGTALIGRLIAQSHLEGGQGKLLIRPRSSAKPFYVKIGFRASEKINDVLLLNAAGAISVLNRALW